MFKTKLPTTRRALAILLAVALLGGLSHAPLAQTPYSTPKSCNYQGGTPCPAAAVEVENWLYGPSQPLGGGPNTFATASEAAQSLVTVYLTQHPTWCSGTFTPLALTTTYTEYGLPYIEYYSTTYTFISDETLNPPCSNSWQPSTNILAQRPISCPTGYSLVYTSSPLVGPYCAAQTNPVPNKQTGCLICSSRAEGANSGAANAGSGGTTRGDPVDVSNGNKYHVEVDYAGAGTNPIKFVRTYNSAGAQCEPTYGAGSPYVGGGWSATYFQNLVPVTVTDSTTTYNSVYAYRPDGRVLVFNLYNAVYSPDGDVADSLIKTSNGWQYQTADDTIETYNSAGQLISLAARGQSPLTITYASGNGPGDPPISVSDAFGHTLQFSYAASQAGNLLLASITDPSGTKISYAFDAYGYQQLTTVMQADNTTRTYGYSSSSCLLTGLTDEASVLYASWTYGSYPYQPATAQLAGGVEAYSFGYSTNDSGGSVTVTDPLQPAAHLHSSVDLGLIPHYDHVFALPGLRG